MTEDYRELLLGCGHDRRKRYCAVPHHATGWRNPKGPVTLDLSPWVKPDLRCNLNMPPPWIATRADDITPHRLDSDYWDEIHAYHVLEHLGAQGDYFSFFAHFSELWRILKPEGYLVAEVPSRSCDGLWGDPGHARAIVRTSIAFLDQDQYRLQCDGPAATRTSMTDYREIYRADFKIVTLNDDRSNFVFVLQAVKPSRVRWPRP